MFMSSTHKVSNAAIKFHVWAGISFLSLGYFFINFSLLESATRQAVAFSMFGVAIAFSIFEVVPDIVKRGYLKGYVIGAFIMIYSFFFSKIIPPFDEYGANKYLYFMLVAFMGFMAFPPLLKYNSAVEGFTKLLF